MTEVRAQLYTGWFDSCVLPKVHCMEPDDLKAIKQDVVQLNVIRLCVCDLKEQRGMEIPLLEMPTELQPKPKNLHIRPLICHRTEF